MNSLIKYSIYIIILIVFIINGIELSKNISNSDISSQIQSYDIDNRQYYFKHAFEEKFIKIEKPKPKPKVEKKIVYKLLNNITIKAIYTKNKDNGWIIISPKESNKTIILTIGELFKEYKLKYIFPKYVIFSKNSNEYKVYLENTKKDGVKNEIK
jgi:hypothetical protein